jgi:hypothetical protein
MGAVADGHVGRPGSAPGCARNVRLHQASVVADAMASLSRLVLHPRGVCLPFHTLPWRSVIATTAVRLRWRWTKFGVVIVDMHLEMGRGPITMVPAIRIGDLPGRARHNAGAEVRQAAAAGRTAKPRLEIDTMKAGGPQHLAVLSYKLPGFAAV